MFARFSVVNENLFRAALLEDFKVLLEGRKRGSMPHARNR
jgi:hypothetical protein